MITPNYLKKDDKVAIIAPARKISRKEVDPAIKILESWGLSVVLGKSLFKSFNQFAGTDEERAFDLQKALDDDSVKAIICARGGYGSVRIIDKIDFSHFVRNPKWIVGYSDITALHSHIHTHFGIETLHATMAIHFGDKKMSAETFESLRKALFGEPLSYHLDTSPLSKKGTSSGILIGGNLSVLYSLTGTPSDIVTNKKILLLEDLDEYLYHVDRMMVNLKHSGKLSNLAGLIVGGMTEMNDNTIPFGKTANEIIAETVADYNYPVCYNFPSGHSNDNRALILGRNIELHISDTVEVVFDQR